jgi:hypothetical protein
VNSQRKVDIRAIRALTLKTPGGLAAREMGPIDGAVLVLGVVGGAGEGCGAVTVIRC